MMMSAFCRMIVRSLARLATEDLMTVVRIVSALAFVVGGVAGVSVPATAAEPAPVERVSERPDRGQAVASARAQGSRVEVAAERSEYRLVFANPDGSFTAEVSAGPERLRNADGSWLQIDTTLEATAGGVRPKASAAALTLSNGGKANSVVASIGSRPQDGPANAAALADARDASRAPVVAEPSQTGPAFSLRWAAALPAPRLDGSTATYSDVADGVDLKIEVLPRGFESYLILKKPPKRGTSFSLPFSLRSAAMTREADGSLRLKDAGGRVIGMAPAARMWDSRIDPRSGGPARELEVATTLVQGRGGATLKVTPAADFLSDPATQYPVIVDPVTTLAANMDTFVEKGYNGTNFGSATDLRSGTYDGGAHVARALMVFPLSGLAGVRVDSASLKLFEYWSSSCTPRKINVKRVTGGWGENSTTWNSQPPIASTVYGSASEAHGYSGSCPGDWLGGSNGVAITSLVQAWVDGTVANCGLTLRAENEADSLSWKRFNSAENSSRRPYLSVNYRRYPDAPSAPAASPQRAGFVNSTTPTLSAPVSDPDGGNVRGLFEVFSGGNVVWRGYSGWVGSGGTAAAAVPAGVLAEGGTYSVRVFGDDGGLQSKSASATTAFTVDTTGPAPDVTSSLYIPGGSVEYTDDSPSASFTWAPTGASPVASYRYSKDGAAAVTQTGKALTWYPQAGHHTLTVSTMSPTGAASDPATYTFDVTAVGVPSTPTKQKTGATDTTSPAISGVVSTRTGGQVRAKFYVTDSAGSPVGQTPYAEGADLSGSRITARIPDATLTAGQSYSWTMQACSDAGCSAKTAPRPLVINPIDPPEPATVTTVIDTQHLTTLTVDANPTGCSGSPCQGTIGGDSVKVGFDGSKTWRSYLTPEVSAIPVGSVVQSANLKFTAASRLSGSAPVSVEVRPLTDAWMPADTSDRLASLALSGDAYQAVPVDAGTAPSFDLGPLVTQWRSSNPTVAGIELRSATEATNAATSLPGTSSQGAPVIEVTYAPPVAPESPRDISADAADSGAAVTWSSPRYSGYSGDIDEYRITARNPDGTIAVQATSQSTSVDLTGLSNGTTYTIEVSAKTAHGESPPVAATVTPALASATTSELAEAAQQFFQARMKLQDGTSNDAASALTGMSRAPMLTAALSAQAPKLLTDRNLVASHTSVPLGAGTTQLSNVLVLPTSNGATVQASVKTTLPNTVGDETVDEESESTESLAFERDAAGGLVLTGQMNTQQASYTPDIDAGADIQPVPTASVAQASVDGPTPIGTGADGWPRADGEPATASAADPFDGNRRNMTSWARDHYLDPIDIGPGCTNFVSKALNFGFGVRFRLTPWYMGPAYQVAKRGDSHYWWRIGTWKGGYSYSWAAAQNNANFLGLNPGSWLTSFSQALPGDVVYYDEHRDGKIDHTSVVTRVKNGRPFVTQQQDSFLNKSLYYQWAHNLHRDANIYIRRVRFI